MTAAVFESRRIHVPRAHADEPLPTEPNVFSASGPQARGIRLRAPRPVPRGREDSSDATPTARSCPPPIRGPAVKIMEWPIISCTEMMEWPINLMVRASPLAGLHTQVPGIVCYYCGTRLAVGRLRPGMPRSSDRPAVARFLLKVRQPRNSPMRLLQALPVVGCVSRGWTYVSSGADTTLLPWDEVTTPAFLDSGIKATAYSGRLLPAAGLHSPGDRSMHLLWPARENPRRPAPRRVRMWKLSPCNLDTDAPSGVPRAGGVRCNGGRASWGRRRGAARCPGRGSDRPVARQQRKLIA